MIEFVRLHHLKPGDVIAKPLYLPNGKLLAGKGARVTERSVGAMQEMGYHGLYIESDPEDRREAVPVEEPWLSDEESHQAVFLLARMFSSARFLDDPYDVDFTVAMREVGEQSRMICARLMALHKTRGLIYEFDDLRSKHDWILFHSLNACLLSVAMAVERDVPARDLEQFAIGALLHDLAKVEATMEVVNKREISMEEREMLRAHPERMFRILQKRGLGVPAAYAVWQHHEHADGSGYPNALSGKGITIWGQMLALANTFDNMTHYTPYKDAVLTPGEAIEILYADPRFETESVRALASIVAAYPVGTKVALSDGSSGIVVKNSKNMPLRPTIAIGGQAVDLSEEMLSTTISGAIKE